MDSMNLRFMEIQLFAEFGEWSKIVNLPDLRDICAARKTSIILNLILSALRLTYINVDDPINEQKKPIKNMFMVMQNFYSIHQL